MQKFFLVLTVVAVFLSSTAYSQAVARLPEAPRVTAEQGNSLIIFVENFAARLFKAVASGGTTELQPVPGPQASPKTLSIKDAEGSRIEYQNDSFCVGSVSQCPDRKVIDGASDGLSAAYLMSDGRIIDSSGALIVYAPKMESIARIDDKWFLLRNDGQVFVTTDLSAPSSFIKVIGLSFPRMRRIASGGGPAKF